MPAIVPPTPQEIAKLREKAHLYDQYLASYQEVQRIRNEQALTIEGLKSYIEEILLQVLEIEDDFGRAIDYATKGQNFEAVLAGLEPISHKMMHFLKKHGVEMIEAAGETFNPTCHKCLDPLPTLEFDQLVVTKELRPGFRFGGKVLRKTIVEVQLKDKISVS